MLVSIPEMKYTSLTKEELIDAQVKAFSTLTQTKVLSNANGLSQLIDIITDTVTIDKFKWLFKEAF